MVTLQNIVETAWENRTLLQEEITTNAIREVIALLDAGTLRVAEPTANGWQVNEWVKKAVVMYFPIQKMETWEAGIFEYHDKMLLLCRKRNTRSPTGNSPLWCLYFKRGNFDAELCQYRCLCR